MKKIIVLLAAMVAVETKAGFLAEPYLGYELGAIKVTDATGTTVSTSSATGLGYGARLGYRFVSAWVAADVCMSTGKLKDTLGSNADADFSETAMGLTAGLDLPIGIRLFAGYGVSQEFKTKYSDSTEDKFTGSYTKLGVGFRLIPKLNLNLEYKMNTYKEYTGTTGTVVDLGATGGKYEHNPLFLSASFSF